MPHGHGRRDGIMEPCITVGAAEAVERRMAANFRAVCSQIDGELRELRCHYGSSQYRVLYRRSERLLVLLHMLSRRLIRFRGRKARRHIARVLTC